MDGTLLAVARSSGNRGAGITGERGALPEAVEVRSEEPTGVRDPIEGGTGMLLAIEVVLPPRDPGAEP